LNYLDDRINSADDAELLGLRVVGAIPHYVKKTAPPEPSSMSGAARITAVGT
jgi:hypothetical protein